MFWKVVTLNKISRLGLGISTSGKKRFIVLELNKASSERANADPLVYIFYMNISINLKQ
jgi:hypothetical protein